MSEQKDAIRNMVQNLIKDNTAGAEMDIHPVFAAKMKSAAGIVTKQEPQETVEIDTESEETEEND